MTDPVHDRRETRHRASGSGAIRVRRALISVSDKTGVVDFARAWRRSGSRSSPPAAPRRALREAGIEVRDVAEFTGSPEILDGRVKTLHPRLHAALLARRDDPEHMATLEREGIEPIDLVCVNLYPFEQTVAGSDVTDEVAIENIDIGGPTMIRAAAKNHALRRRGRQARVLRRRARRAGGVGRRDLGRDPALARQRGVRADGRATTRRSAAGSRTRYEDFPEHLVMALREGPRPLLRREPAPAAALYAEVGSCAPTCSRASPSCTAGRSPSTTCSTSTRPGACSTTSSRRLRDRQAQQPLRRGDRRRRRSRPTRRRSPATRCRPSAA